jgi:hypothetical protein
MAESDDLNLWYGDVLVGRVRDAFLSDGTWFGSLELAIRPDGGELPRRLLEFIRFCEDWNERVRDDSADVAEFAAYSDLVGSRLWATTDSAGRRTRIAEAPVFFAGDEVTWTSV